MAKLDKAPVYETGDCWFEPSRVRHLFTTPTPHRHLIATMTDSERPTERDDDSNVAGKTEAGEKSFHGWRLLGYLGIVVLSLAVVAAIVDWMVLGPLLGRVF